MWLLADVAGTLAVTALHGEDDAGHTHLEEGRGGGGGQGLSCVDTSHSAPPPGACGRVNSAALGGRTARRQGAVFDRRRLMLSDSRPTSAKHFHQ